MTELADVKAKLIDASGRQTSDTNTWGDHSLDLWEPFIVSKEEIDAEVERLSATARPNNGVRRTYFVHPRAESHARLDLLRRSSRTPRRTWPTRASSR